MIVGVTPINAIENYGALTTMFLYWIALFALYDPL